MIDRCISTAGILTPQPSRTERGSQALHHTLLRPLPIADARCYTVAAPAAAGGDGRTPRTRRNRQSDTSPMLAVATTT